MMLNKKKIKGKIISLIGLPGSGKTTIAKKIRSILIKNNISNLHLDGDDLRSALINKNYTRKNRVKLSRIYLRLSEMLLKQNDVILLSSVSLYDEIEKIYSKKPHIKVFYIEKKFIIKIF